MPKICESCRSRTYCSILNYKVFQYIDLVIKFDECPLYTPEDGYVMDRGNTPDQEKEFEIHAEITVHCKMKEFLLDKIKPENYSQLKRLSILIDKEGLERELKRILDREIKSKLGIKCKDSVMREHAKTTIEVPLIFSNWVLN